MKTVREVSNKQPESNLEKGFKPLSRTKTIKVLGEDIPIYWFEHPTEITIEDILSIQSADCRTVVIRDLYYEGTIGFYRDLLKSGKGEIVLTPTKDDYQYGRILQVEFNEVLNKYLEVINRTPEPWAEHLSEEDRLKKGLTKEGYKTVLLGLDPTIKYETVWQAWFWTFGFEAKNPEEFFNKYGFKADNLVFIES